MRFNTSKECDQKETSLKQPYFIATAPRSGSSLLGLTLAAQGLGIPLEYYNFQNNPPMSAFAHRILGYQTADNIPIPEYSLQLLKKRTTPNGVFGCKIFTRHHRRSFGDNFALEQQLFPNLKYIWLKRRDLIERAISYYFVTQTQQWNSQQKARRSMNEVAYDFEKILSIFRLLKDLVQYWSIFFKSHPDVDVLTLYYSDLANDYESTIRTVNHFLGFEDLEIPEQPIRKLESPLKTEFKKRFIQDVRKNRITQ